MSGKATADLTCVLGLATADFRRPTFANWMLSRLGVTDRFYASHPYL